MRGQDPNERTEREAPGRAAARQAAEYADEGRFREALASIDAALLLEPDWLEGRVERAEALFELCRFDEAKVASEEVIRLDPEEPLAHHLLGLIAERQGQAREAEKRFARASRLAPEEFPRQVRLSPAEFDAAVEDALTSLPEQVRRYLSNVAIAVEGVPSSDDLLGSDPPLSPQILGLFRGAPYGEKASMDPWSQFPSSIVLYQKNLERYAQDREELLDEIAITLVHEVGHFLGLDEEDLWERGLD
jgi:predicted Zn-dependent protease with MMP-like domain